MLHKYVLQLLLKPDVVFNSESDSCNFSSLASSGGEKKLFLIFFCKTIFYKKSSLPVLFHSTVVCPVGQFLKSDCPYSPTFSEKNCPSRKIRNCPYRPTLIQKLVYKEKNKKKNAKY